MAKRLIITIPAGEFSKDALNSYIDSIDERFVSGSPIFVPAPLTYEIVDIDDVNFITRRKSL